MEIASRKKLREFSEDYPDAESPLNRWRRIVEEAEWEKFADVRAAFQTADMVGKLIVFNIGGNKYRLIADVDYDNQEVQIRHVLTHAEYDKGRWKTGHST